MVEDFKNKLKYLALLDAILEQDWELRYYSYNSGWSPEEKQQGTDHNSFFFGILIHRGKRRSARL